MIFKNKDSGKSSIFGDKTNIESNEKPAVNNDMLESMRKKAWSDAPQAGDSIRNRVFRGSGSTDDASSSGRAFVGRDSSRSIFDSISNNEKTSDSKTASANLRNSDREKRIQLEDERRKQVNPQGDLVKKESSIHASDSGRIGTSARNISIFDSKPFERMSDHNPEMKKDINVDSEPVKGSRQLSSRDVFDKTFSSLDQTADKMTRHQSAVDKIWSSIKGSNNGKDI